MSESARRHQAPPPDGWQEITLVGEPHDGQVMQVPTHQDAITIWDGPTPVSYYRQARSRRFISEAKLARLLGGGRR